jgi:hypothetical protein
MGTEISESVVSPVVAAPLFDKVVIVNELVNWHQLDCRHSEANQVFEHSGIADCGKCPSFLGGDRRVLHGEAANMGLVDDAFMGWCS